MAKKTSAKPAKAAKDIVKKFNPFKASLKYLTWVFFIILGGFLFNLDRMDQFGLELLKHKEFIPYRLRYFLPGGTASEGKAQKRDILLGKVIEVYDGDTITLLAGQQKYKIRFYGIDAPEAAQTYGIAARDTLRKKILGKEVQVSVENLDQYDRCIGKVRLDSRNINLEMVREGCAWYYESYARNDYHLELAQKEAKDNKLGIWQQSDPTPPWKFRKQ